jgi:hypothetical protein
VRSELDRLRRVNPVAPDEAESWISSEQAEARLRRLFDAIESDTTSLEPSRDAAPRSHGPWRVAVAAAAAVLIVAAIPFWILGPGRDPAPASTRVPVEIGIEYVWPDGGWPGTAADVAVAFATQVLGWPQVTPVPDPQADPDGPVWVRLLVPGGSELSVLTVPRSADTREVLQIGAPPEIWLSEAGAVDDGPWLALRMVEGAATADVSIRLLGVRDAVGFRLDAAELDGQVDLPAIDGRLIATVLVRYRDVAGTVIAATGGRYATEPPLDAAPSPEEILADGVVTRAEYQAAAEATLDCLRARGIRAGFGLSATGTPSYSTRDADDPEGQSLASCLGEHVGRVSLVWADQNAPSPQREIEFYNDVVDCVEVHTGGSYGDVEAVGDHKATDAAIAAARGVYDECFMEILPRYPDVGSSR